MQMVKHFRTKPNSASSAKLKYILWKRTFRQQIETNVEVEACAAL